MPQYNEVQYNVSQYNVSLLTTTLVDLVNQADADQVETTAIVKTEVANMAVALFKLFNNDPFLDDLMSLDDTLVKEALIVKLDSLTSTDASVTFSIIKSAVETMTPAEVVTFVASMLRIDNIFINGNAIVEISNKGLGDTVQLALWFKIKRTKNETTFGD